MSRSDYRFALLLTVTGLLCFVPTVKPSAAAILEPDFTRAPVRDGNYGLCGSFEKDKCKPGETVPFRVNKPYNFAAVTNDSEFDITDIHMKIVGTTTVTWGDVDGNGFVGKRGNDSSASIFQKTGVSGGGKIIDLSGGIIKKGEAFNPLFIVGGIDSVSIEATFTVPEPSTPWMLGGMAAALGFVAWRRSVQLRNQDG